MSITKFNKVTRKFTAEINENATFATLKELYNEDTTDVYEIKSFFKNTHSKFGEHYVINTGDFLVDIPKHMNNTFNEMYDDDEIIKEINEGKCGFTIYKYSKNHREYYSITFVDYIK